MKSLRHRILYGLLYKKNIWNDKITHAIKIIVSDNGPPPVEQSDDGWLNFTKITRAESGWYKCYTRHMLGIFTSIGYFLNIRCEYIRNDELYNFSLFFVFFILEREREREVIEKQEFSSKDSYIIFICHLLFFPWHFYFYLQILFFLIIFFDPFILVFYRIFFSDFQLYIGLGTSLTKKFFFHKTSCWLPLFITNYLFLIALFFFSCFW